MTKLAIIEVLACYATPIQLGQIHAAKLKDAKYLGKKNPLAIFEIEW